MDTGLRMARTINATPPHAYSKPEQMHAYVAAKSIGLDCPVLLLCRANYRFAVNMLVDGLRAVVDAAIKGEKVVERRVADLKAPRRDVHSTDDRVARLLVVHNELVEIRIVVYPGTVWQVRPTRLYDIAIATFQIPNSMAEADGSVDRLLQPTLGHGELRDIHVSGRDGCPSRRHAGRDGRRHAAAEPERLPLVDRYPVCGVHAHDVRVFVVEAHVHAWQVIAAIVRVERCSGALSRNCGRPGRQRQRVTVRSCTRCRGRHVHGQRRDRRWDYGGG